MAFTIFVSIFLIVFPLHSTQSLCPQGQYATYGQCVTCIPGAYCPGNDAQYPCLAGTYNKKEGQPECVKCPAHQFSEEGKTSCTRTCPGGTFKGREPSSCYSCSPGSFSLSNSSECRTCPAGTYSYLHSAHCIQCGPGRANSNAGSTSADACIKSMVAGFAHCKPCRIGTYNDYSESQSCFSCPSGSTTMNVGSSSVNDCIAIVPKTQFVFAIVANVLTALALIYVSYKYCFREKEMELPNKYKNF